MFSFEDTLQRQYWSLLEQLSIRQAPQRLRTNTGTAAVEMDLLSSRINSAVTCKRAFEQTPSSHRSTINTCVFGTRHTHSTDSAAAQSPEHCQHREAWSC